MDKLNLITGPDLATEQSRIDRARMADQLMSLTQARTKISQALEDTDHKALHDACAAYTQRVTDFAWALVGCTGEKHAVTVEYVHAMADRYAHNRDTKPMAIVAEFIN